MQVIPLHLPPGDLSQERTVQIDGTSEQIEAAKLMVDEVISEVCPMVALSCFALSALVHYSYYLEIALNLLNLFVLCML